MASCFKHCLPDQCPLRLSCEASFDLDQQASVTKMQPLSPCNKQFCKFGLYIILLKLISVCKYLLSPCPQLIQLVCASIESSCNYWFKKPNQILHIPLTQMLQQKALFCLKKPEIFVVTTYVGVIPRQTTSCMEDLRQASPSLMFNNMASSSPLLQVALPNHKGWYFQYA